MFAEAFGIVNQLSVLGLFLKDPWFDFFTNPSLLTLLVMILKDLGLVCYLPEIPHFYGRHVAQYQALGSRQGT